LRNFIVILAALSTFSVVAKDMTGVSSQSKVKAVLESSIVRDTVEQTERIHSVKCKLKSVTNSIGDQFVKYKCKSPKNKIKLVLRAGVSGDSVNLKNYKVFFKK